MYLDNLLPRQLAALAAPSCLIDRLRFPKLVSFGMLANLKAMRQRGIFTGINSIVDVGANIGQFAYMIHRVCHNTPVFSLEPDPVCFAELKQTFKRFGIPGRCLPYAASDRGGEATLYLHPIRVNNSLLKSAAPWVAQLSTATVPCATLNELMRDVQADSCLLKLDVQGYEMHVLKGAVSLLGRCKVVIVEVSFDRIYRDGASASEVVTWLQEHGFAVHDILDILRHGPERGSGLREADLLFVKQ